MDHEREDGGPLMETAALPPTIGEQEADAERVHREVVEALVPAAPAPTAHPNSILEQLRAVRDQDQGDDELVIRLPMYDDKIALVFRYPEVGYKAFEAIGTKAAESKDPLAMLAAACQTIALCCVDVRGVVGDELVPLDGDATRGPLPLGKELAGLLGIDVPAEVRDPRTLIVRHLYSPRAHETGVFRGDVAVVTDYGRLSQFVNEGAAAAQDRFVGE